jgi:hypothetical protein
VSDCVKEEEEMKKRKENFPFLFNPLCISALQQIFSKESSVVLCFPLPGPIDIINDFFLVELFPDYPRDTSLLSLNLLSWLLLLTLPAAHNLLKLHRLLGCFAPGSVLHLFSSQYILPPLSWLKYPVISRGSYFYLLHRP